MYPRNMVNANRRLRVRVQSAAQAVSLGPGWVYEDRPATPPAPADPSPARDPEARPILRLKKRGD
jgi:hypothetical protein